LETANYPTSFIDRVDSATAANLGGIQRLLSMRTRNQRDFVVGFNKIKHSNLALLRVHEERVIFPRYKGAELDADEQPLSVELQTPEVSCQPRRIRELAEQAVIGQAVLNSILLVLLYLRYGERLNHPEWAVDALGLRSWYQHGPSEVDGLLWPESSDTE
jgi:hypothetical protein